MTLVDEIPEPNAFQGGRVTAFRDRRGVVRTHHLVVVGTRVLTVATMASTGRMSSRRHPGGDQAGPARALPARRPSDRRSRTARQVSLSLGGSVYDAADAVGRLLFNVLAMVAGFESDLIRLRTCEGMRVAKAKGRLRGMQPRLNRRREVQPRLLGAHWRVRHGRGRRTLRHRALHRLPRHRTTPPRRQSRACRDRDQTLNTPRRRRMSRIRHGNETPPPHTSSTGSERRARFLSWGAPSPRRTAARACRSSTCDVAVLAGRTDDRAAAG